MLRVAWVVVGGMCGVGETGDMDGVLVAWVEWALAASACRVRAALLLEVPLLTCSLPLVHPSRRRVLGLRGFQSDPTGSLRYRRTRDVVLHSSGCAR